MECILMCPSNTFCFSLLGTKLHLSLESCCDGGFGSARDRSAMLAAALNGMLRAAMSESPTASITSTTHSPLAMGRAPGSSPEGCLWCSFLWRLTVAASTWTASDKQGLRYTVKLQTLSRHSHSVPPGLASWTVLAQFKAVNKYHFITCVLHSR